MYICELCNFSNINKRNLFQHYKSNLHLDNEEKNLSCCKCNKIFKSLSSYKTHKHMYHNKNKKIIITKNKTICKSLENNVNDQLNDIKDNINNNINNKLKHIEDKIDNSKKEVVTVVNKAINKASSLIKYLMENHRSVPPLKKITKNQCIPILRLDYNCPEIDKDYSLQKLFVRDYSKNMFVSNIAKSILKMINHTESDKQPIYNTDSSRYNYVVKITGNIWNEDKSGIKFTDYIIKPLLKYIRDLVEEYIENDLEEVNMYKNTFIQNQIHVQQKEDAYNLDIQLTNDYLIKPLLKELSPHLRFLQIELEEIEKLEELTKIQDELEEMINGNSYSDESEDELEKVYDSDINDNYIKKIKVRMIKV
jgi:ElaB/YqjD/DUF883 family membrane-anchored ribosome-binding protein